MTGPSRHSIPEPWSEQRLAEAVEAVRYPCNDLDNAELVELAGLAEQLDAAPEWQQRAGRIAGWDKRIAAAIDSGPVPAGLADRLLDQLATAEGAPADEVDAGLPSLMPTEEMRHNTIRRRRWLWVAAGLTGLAASLLVVASLWRSTPLELNSEQLLELAEVWRNGPQATEPTPLRERAPRQAFHPPSEVHCPAQATWVVVDNLAERRGVMYELAPGAPRRATLFVLPLKGRPVITALSNRPPRTPRTTGNRASAAWHDGNRLFVLIVDGDAREFRAYLRSSSPIA